MVPESALASTGSADLANADDAVATDFLFNAPFALEPFSLGGDFFVSVLVILVLLL